MQGPNARTKVWLCAVLGALIAALASLSPAAGTAVATPAPTEGGSLFSLAPGMHALAITAGPDGNFWFAGGKANFGPSDGKVGRVTPAGQVAEFPLPDPGHEGASSIVTGPDGSLWFTEPGYNRIGRATPAGAIAEFPLPAADSRPNAIAVGPDGSLWFTEEGADRIGRITPTGAIAEFPLQPGSRPAGIVTGPDGNLWFTERGANRIGRIGTGGELTEFALPGRDRHPAAIVTGPDGNLWFTEAWANQIGRITPAGEIAQFPVPVLAGTEDIVAGPDGNLWFVAGLQIGSISPSGVPVQLTCVDAACRLPVFSLTAGRGGELWFGTDMELLGYTGGMTAMYALVNQPGYVGSLAPRQPSTAFGPRAERVRGRWTSLGLSCEDPAGCDGVLRLTRRLSAYPHRRYFNTENLLLAERRYALGPGESRRVHLRLTRRAAELLSEHGRLGAWAKAGREGHAEAVRSTVLQRGAGRGLVGPGS